MKINTIIVDDDEMSRKILANLVEENEYLNLMGQAQDAQEAFDLIKANQVNLIFLDIVMPSMSGLDFLNALNQKPYIILTTSYKEYALDAFEYDVNDYMVKPVKSERFEKAVNKIIDKFHTDRGIPSNFEEYVITNALKYLYTRGEEFLTPKANRYSKIGYSYPIISTHFNYENEHKVLDVLNLAQNEGLIEGHFEEAIYLCANCYEGFIHYREVCPKCTSSNLHSEDLVHHFPCAYIGPFSDFTSGRDANELRCPKCDRSLKHIGVDYDKPSLIYNCNNCNHKFQDVFVKARCLSCGTDMEVEHLTKKIIHNYQITNKGVEVAKSNTAFTTTVNQDEKVPGSVDLETFTLMLKYEIKRKEIADFDSNMAYIYLANQYQLFNDLDREERKSILTLIVDAIKHNISSSDIVTFKTQSTILFSLTETNKEEANQVVKAIVDSLKTTLQKHYPEFKPKISYGVKPIQNKDDHTEQLNELTKPITSG